MELQLLVAGRNSVVVASSCRRSSQGCDLEGGKRGLLVLRVPSLPSARLLLVSRTASPGSRFSENQSVVRVSKEHLGAQELGEDWNDDIWGLGVSAAGSVLRDLLALLLSFFVLVFCIVLFWRKYPDFQLWKIKSWLWHWL